MLPSESMTYTPSQLYAMSPDQLSRVVEEVLGISGDYRDPSVLSLIIQKGKQLFVDQPFINTKGLKVDESVRAESAQQEITIGVILAFLGKDRPFN